MDPEGLDHYGKIAATSGQTVYGKSGTAAREPLAQWTRSVTVPVTAPQPGVVLILTLNVLAVVLLCPLLGMPRALRDSEHRCDTRMSVG